MKALSKQVLTVVMGMLAVLLLPVLLAGLGVLLFVIFVRVAFPLCNVFTGTGGIRACAQCLPVCPVAVTVSLLIVPPAVWLALRLLKDRSRLP